MRGMAARTQATSARADTRPPRRKTSRFDVTLQLGAYIEENLPEVKVIYTRKDDSFPALRERVCESPTRPRPTCLSPSIATPSTTLAHEGSSTYVMGMHKSEESLRVAMRENASMFKEEGYESQLRRV